MNGGTVLQEMPSQPTSYKKWIYKFICNSASRCLLGLLKRVWLCHRFRMCVLRFEWVVAKYYKVCCGEWCETAIEQVDSGYKIVCRDSMDTPCS